MAPRSCRHLGHGRMEIWGDSSAGAAVSALPCLIRRGIVGRDAAVEALFRLGSRNAVFRGAPVLSRSPASTRGTMDCRFCAAGPGQRVRGGMRRPAGQLRVGGKKAGHRGDDPQDRQPQQDHNDDPLYGKTFEILRIRSRSVIHWFFHGEIFSLSGWWPISCRLSLPRKSEQRKPSFISLFPRPRYPPGIKIELPPPFWPWRFTRRGAACGCRRCGWSRSGCRSTRPRG